MYNPSGRDDGFSGRAHAVENMTGHFSARIRARASQSRSSGRSHAGNFAMADHDKKEPIMPFGGPKTDRT